MMFCRAYPNMKQDAWNGAHGEGFEAFGGVSQTVVPDNAATATNRHSAADGAQEVNARYQELAAHFSTAIVPARSKHPRGKVVAEAAGNVANTRVIGYLAEEFWDSLTELNTAIEERAREINEEMRLVDGTARHELFHRDEAHLLQPLPQEGSARTWLCVIVERKTPTQTSMRSLSAGSNIENRGQARGCCH